MSMMRSIMSDDNFMVAKDAHRARPDFKPCLFWLMLGSHDHTSSMNLAMGVCYEGFVFVKYGPHLLSRMSFCVSSFYKMSKSVNIKGGKNGCYAQAVQKLIAVVLEIFLLVRTGASEIRAVVCRWDFKPSSLDSFASMRWG